jgi:drug/metabolite transporter (DMT)-like permease
VTDGIGGRLSDSAVAYTVWMCLIWGATWIAAKAGVSAVPPVLFAATRFIAAGLLLFGWLIARREPLGLARADWGKVLGVSLLMVSLCYSLLFWGMGFVNSGTAALVDLSLTPVFLLVFAMAHGEERFSRERALAIALGVAGLAVLFGPKALAGSHSRAMELVGGGAIVVSAAIYSWGSVLARPLLRAYPSTLMAALTTLVGGIVLLVGSVAFEPGARAALSGHWGLGAWIGWAFLVLFGSLVGYVVYMRLLHSWGASRAGAYAFVSPAVAVPLGMVWYGETVGPADLIAMAMMLTAAWLAVRDKTESRVVA